MRDCLRTKEQLMIEDVGETLLSTHITGRYLKMMRHKIHHNNVFRVYDTRSCCKARLRQDEEGLDRCDEQHQRLEIAVPRLNSGQDLMVKHEFVNNKDHLGQGLDDDDGCYWTWYDREGGSSGMSM